RIVRLSGMIGTKKNLNHLRASINAKVPSRLHEGHQNLPLSSLLIFSSHPKMLMAEFPRRTCSLHENARAATWDIGNCLGHGGTPRRREGSEKATSREAHSNLKRNTEAWSE